MRQGKFGAIPEPKIDRASMAQVNLFQ